MTVPGGGTAAGGGGGASGFGSALGVMLFAAVLLAGAALEDAEPTLAAKELGPAALDCEPFAAFLLMESEPGAQQ